MTFLYGMAVLIVYFTFTLLSYLVFKNVNWKIFFTEEATHLSDSLAIILSIATGYLISSFILSIIEILQNMFLSRFL